MSTWHVHLYTRMALNLAGDWFLVELEEWVSGPLPAQYLGCCAAQSAGETQVVMAPARGGEAGAAAWSGRKVLQGFAKLLKTPLRLWARGDGLTVLLPMGAVAQRPPSSPFHGHLVGQG